MKHYDLTINGPCSQLLQQYKKNWLNLAAYTMYKNHNMEILIDKESRIHPSSEWKKSKWQLKRKLKINCDCIAALCTGSACLF